MIVKSSQSVHTTGAGAAPRVLQCKTARRQPRAREKAPHLTILVSIDGFRADYLDRGDTPTLKALADDGARGAMRPSFPSLTYPNHYTLVTGKRPDHHGVVGNEMEDAIIGGPKFTMNGPTANDPRWWNQAMPFWVSAEQQGRDPFRRRINGISSVRRRPGPPSPLPSPCRTRRGGGRSRRG